MSELDLLTTAFLEDHPQESARELERLPVAAVAALVHGAPARIAAPVMAKMRPYAAAETLLALEGERAALVLGALPALQAAALLRHVPAASRSTLLDALPTRLALACRALLRFPEDAVGAVMQTPVTAVGERATVAETLDVLRGREGGEGGFIVDDAGRLLGWVSAAGLLRADPALRVGTLARGIASLPAMMPAAAALEQPGVLEAPVAAVVGQDGQLLGAVTAGLLREAGRPDADGDPMPGDSALGILAQQYWGAVAGLSDAFLSMCFGKARSP